jgi:hypothetical protein
MKDEDIVLRCEDCGKEFIFSAGEQVFYEEKELYPPKRCSFCRKKRRKEYAASEGAGLYERNRQ